MRAHFFGRASHAQKNRAFRCKSSDLLMQILWAFRCNPLRTPSGIYYNRKEKEIYR
jgi:hypothetical protein